MEVDNKLLIYMPYNPPFGGGGHDDKSYFINLDLQLVVDGKSIYFHAHNYIGGGHDDKSYFINLDLQPTKWWVA